MASAALLAEPCRPGRPCDHYSGVCHGTLGELFQGPYDHAGSTQIAIISLPIRRYSWAHFEAGPAGDLAAETGDRPRCRRAIDLFLEHYGRSMPSGRWSFASDLPRGKGMASSTADIVATIRCLDAIHGTDSRDLVPVILRDIERSDSVFLEGHALYLSGAQQVVRALPDNDGFHVCYLDDGGTVDTEAVTPRLLDHYHAQHDAYARVLMAMLDGFDRHDLSAIAAAATHSAALAQQVTPKRAHAALAGERERFGADGIVVAHTGSLIGYLFACRPDPRRLGDLAAFYRSLGHQCACVRTGF